MTISPAQSSARILLVEDDLALGREVRSQLRAAGFEVDWWSVGRSIEPEMLRDLSLVVLDLMLPQVDGFTMLSAIRAHAQVPVLVLSARHDTQDKVRALRLGADDYVTKPFWPEELVERVRARLRRPVLETDETVDRGRLRIDVPARVALLDGAPVELTPVEFNLLLALARRAGSALTRTWLVDHFLDPERATERALDAHISRLRRKLNDYDAIKTVWGVGYRFVTPEP